MIYRILILICMAGISLVSAACGEEKNYEGEIGLRGTLVDVDGEEAKFNEYKDAKDGIVADVRLRYDNEKYFLGLVGNTENGANLTGGIWGIFKFNLYYNEFDHNITNNARSFFSGIGSNSLTGTPNPNPETWGKFDYSTERKKYGAGFRLDLLKPFFVDVALSRENREGIKPTTVGFFPILELPEPVDYRNDTLSIEAGYSKKPFFASVTYYSSQFNNDNHILDFTPFGPPFVDTLTLPPDNTYSKISFKGAIDLPLHSRLSLNAGSATARSHEDILTLGPPLDFDGRVDTKNFDAVLATNPVSFLNGKIFYKYYKKTNRSDVIDDGEVNNLFGYKKSSYGAEAGIRLPAGFHFSAGYKNYKTDYQDRIDVDMTKDNIYSASLKWTGIDNIGVVVGYEKLKRRADFKQPAAQAEQFLARYDIAPKDRDAVRFAVDFTPLENLSFTVGYRYKNTDYDHTALGLKQDKRDEFSVDGSYGIGRIAQLSAYFDYERIRSYQFQRQYDTNPDPGTQDPTNFNWDLLQREKTFDYGAAADIYIIPKRLTLRLQYDNIRSDGNADYTYLLAAALPAGSTNSNIDISDADDYRKRSFLAKLTYDFSKSFSISAGYAYEKYSYSDIQIDGYRHLIAGFPSAYLSGAYSDPSYRANVVFLGVTYRF